MTRPGAGTGAASSILLDARVGWRADEVLSTGVAFADGALTLAPLPGFPQALTDEAGTFGGLQAPLGVAAGAGGDIVVLDRSGTRVLRFDACSSRFLPFSCLDRGRLVGARGVAVTDLGDLVVTDPGARSVLLVTGDGRAIRRVVGPVAALVSATGTWALRPVGPTWSIPPGGAQPEPGWPAGTWEPWGVAAGRGRVVISDRSNGLIHIFDEMGTWCRSTDGSGPGIDALVLPTALALDRDGRVYVLQEGAAVVRVLDAEGAALADTETLDDARSAFCPVAVAVSPQGTLCVAAADGTMCQPRISAHAAAARSLGIAVTGLAFDRDGDPVVTDGSRECVVRLRDGGGYPNEGRFVTSPLDSGWPGLSWHRVVLRGCVPDGTSVRVDTLTAEVAFDPAELASLPESRWVQGPLLGGGDGCARRDLLVRSVPGRFLWLALTLAGDGAATPIVEDIEVELPRRSSRQFLPGVFQAEPTSADFLDRLLSLFDTMRDSVTIHLDELARYIDPMSVPSGEDGLPDFLSWLAHWVGMAADNGLPVGRRRVLIREAASLYARRGTPDGVARFVGLFCGAQTKVLEHYRLRRWAFAGAARLGDASRLFGPAIVKRLQVDVFATIGEFQLVDTGDPVRDPFHVHAHRFTLFVIPARAEDVDVVERLARVALEQGKPAHTLADLVVVRPRMRVGQQATIGLDSVVASIPLPGHLGDRLDCGLVVGAGPTPAHASVLGTAVVGPVIPDDGA